MKKLILLSIFILTIGSLTIFAQQGGGNRGGNRAGGPPSRGTNVGNQTRPQGGNRSVQNGQTQGEQNDSTKKQKKGRNPLRGLDLSDEQKTQIREIRESAKENGTDRETVKEQIRSVLTEEQAAKLEARKKKKAERKKKKRNQGQNPNDQTDEDSDTTTESVPNNP